MENKLARALLGALIAIHHMGKEVQYDPEIMDRMLELAIQVGMNALEIEDYSPSQALRLKEEFGLLIGIQPKDE